MTLTLRLSILRKDPARWSLGILTRFAESQWPKPITLLPNMVADIPCQVQEANGLDELVGMLEPLDKFTERYAAGAFQTAVTIKGG